MIIKKCAIIIPVYKDWETLHKCISSLKEFINQDLFRVILVNDRSSEYLELRELIRNEIHGYDFFSYCENDCNQGFVKTCNLAVEKYTTSNEDILLLNSDTKITEHSLEEMYDVLYSFERIGVVCPRSNNATLLSIPYFDDHDLDRYVYAEECYHTYLKLKSYFPKTQNIPTGVGFCILIKRHLINQFGLFDEIYGKGYNEENDFCMRIMQYGYSIVMANHAFVFHYESRSFSAEEKSTLNKINDVTLDKKYPAYKNLINNYVMENKYNIEYFSKNYFNNQKIVLIDLLGIPLAYNGTSEYSINLLKFLLDINSELFKYRILVRDSMFVEFWGLSKYSSVIIYQSDVTVKNLKFNLGLTLHQYFSFEHFQLISQICEKIVFTCQDIIAIRCNHEPYYLKNLMRSSVDLVDGIIFISDYSKNDLINYYSLEHLPTSSTIYHGVKTEIIHSENSVSELPFDDYILILGNHYPHKNLKTTLDLIKKTKQQNFIVIGAAINNISNIHGYASGEISDNLIELLYRNAKALIFPSVYEGFGLPIINFLKKGAKPVILAKNLLNLELTESVLKEFAEYIYFYDDSSTFLKLIGGIDGLIDKSNLNLKFTRSWQDVARETTDFITQVLTEYPNIELLDRRKIFWNNYEVFESNKLLDFKDVKLNFDDIINSKSWKLTKPLRTFGNIYRKVVFKLKSLIKPN